MYAGVLGLASGVISGLFGVGGGIVMGPVLVFLLGVPIKTAIGTSLMVIVPTAITGSLKHYSQGNVDWKLALTLIPTAIIGSYIGAKLTKDIPAENLKRIFGAFIMIVGARLCFFK